MTNWEKQFDKMTDWDEYEGEIMTKSPDEVKEFVHGLLLKQKQQLLDSLRMEVESELEQWKGDGLMVRRGEYSQQIKKILLKRINDLKE